MIRRLSTALALTLAATTAALLPAGSVAPAAATSSSDPVGWPPAPPVQLAIDTGGLPIGREDYVPGSVTLDGVTHVTEVRGRGNSTWGWAKKPYKLKLEEDAALVGTVPHDEWVLLAGYGDRSSLRTAAAFAIAAQTRLAWTPQFRFVDVVLNGQPQGLYMLTEQVEQGTGRVDLPDDSYLLEINQRYLRDDEPGFRTSQGTPVAFKDPDEITKGQRRQVRRAVTAFEKVLYGPRFAHPKRGYAAHINVRKLIDWYLVEELFANQDSNFQSSVNFSWIPGKKFVFGPVWDFDLSAGTRWQAYGPPDVWQTRVGKHWIARMFEDPAFSTKVKNRWAWLRPRVEAVIAQIESASTALDASAAVDWQLWHASGDLEWTHHGSTRADEVSFLRSWLTQRARWMSRNEARLGVTQVRTRERERTAWVPVQLQWAQDETVTVDYTVAAGTATAGTDFVAEGGRVSFPPGQTTGHVPVRILADEAGEGTESVLVRLDSASGDVAVGSPRGAVVSIGASDQRLDARIRQGGKGRFLGTGVVDARGAGQLLSSRLRRGTTRAYVAQLINTGTHPITLRLHGRSSGPLRVRYAVGGGDPSRLSGSRGRAVRLAPGRTARVRMLVSALPGARPGSRGKAMLRATWNGDVRVADMVGARIRVR